MGFCLTFREADRQLPKRRIKLPGRLLDIGDERLHSGGERQRFFHRLLPVQRAALGPTRLQRGRVESLAEGSDVPISHIVVAMD
jgi:hypothetical protein